MTATPGTSAASVSHPVFARLYARLSRAMEGQGLAEHRRDLLADLSGAVIEVGAGNGLNFQHYPSAVTRVLAVEPEAHLRGLAVTAAAAAPVPVTVVDGVAGALPAEDGEFDVAVASLMLCSVDDQAAALAEMHRVVRSGGRLAFFEHVAAQTSGLLRVQRVLDATVWPHVAGGCHTARDTTAAIAAAGFEIAQVERFRFPDGGVPTPVSPHVLGVATRV